MRLKEFSPTLAVLILIAILAVVAMNLRQEKIAVSSESKNQLTALNPSTSDDKKPLKFQKLRSLFQQSLNTQEQVRRETAPPLVTQERLYTENEIQHMSTQEFKELLREVENKLPYTSELKKVPAGALHRTPELLLAAGKNLGLIKEILNAHENYEAMAIGFYEDCAKNDQRPVAVRALCLTNLSDLKRKSSEILNLKEYPANVVDLARMITDL